MIIRARDLASREIAQIGAAFSTLDNKAQAAARSHIQQGTALMGIGAAMGLAGAAALSFYAGSAKAAMDYNRESALTLTQVDQLGVKLSDIEDIGIRVARNVAAPFEEMQSSLYDIFSSMEVSMQDAEKLLEAHAKAAVAGQTSIQKAGRATIAIMNAFQIPASEVGRVLDVQFQTVRKGVITYEEFSSVIGRAIPSAVRAGASIEELGGALAFATRNGLSAAMASTSVARAFDLLSNPKFASNMKAIGLSVTDAQGRFKPMVQIAEELRQKFKGMSESQVSEQLKNITFGAGGTIQAMRFLNLAVQDSNGLFRLMTEEVQNSAGAFEDAYRIMKDTPAAKIQELKNAWQIFRREIGNAVLPVLGALAVAGKAVIDWFLDLDKETRVAIARFGFLIAVFTTLTGILTFFGGAVLVLVGFFQLLSGSMTPILLSVAGFAALSAAIIYLATQTQFFQTVASGLADFFSNTLWPRIQEIKAAFDAGGLGGVLATLGEMWVRDSPVILAALSTLFSTIGTWIWETGLPTLRTAFAEAGKASWQWIEDAGPVALEKLGALFSSITTWITETGAPQVGESFSTWGKAAWHWIEENTPVAIEKAQAFVEGLIGWLRDTGLPWLIENFQKWGEAAIKWIGDHLPGALEAMSEFIIAILGFIEENAPKFIESGGKILESLIIGFLDNLPQMTGALLVLLGLIIAFIVTDLIPAVFKAAWGIMEAFTEANTKIGITLLETFIEAGANVISFITMELIPSILAALGKLAARFGAEIAPDLIQAVVNPFTLIFNKLVGKSIIPDTVNASLAEWNRLKEQSGITFDQLNNDLTGKGNNLKGSLTTIFGDTGNESWHRFKNGLEPMPGETGRISNETYNAITNALSGLPTWTQGAGHETQAQWVNRLGLGTGGTSNTTRDWARAMLAVLNPLLTGIGADPVGGGDFAQGGIRENHRAQIARGGEWRVWAEPETGGEAYIPLAQSKRGRSIKILREVADRFGLWVSEHAEGGVWPAVPNYDPYGTMIGHGGRSSAQYTYDKVLEWDRERVRKANEAAAAAASAGGSAAVGGLTEAAKAMVSAVLSRFPEQRMTSGYRSPEENARVGGSPTSDHMYGRAADFAPGSDAVAAFLRAYKGIKQVLWKVAGHFDHVHGAVYDKGGMLRTGLNLVENGTGMPEAVLNWDQLKAVEGVMEMAPRREQAAAEPLSEFALAMQGGISELRGAFSEVERAIGGFGGIPGRMPSGANVMRALSDTAGIFAGMAGLPGPFDSGGTSSGGTPSSDLFKVGMAGGIGGGMYGSTTDSSIGNIDIQINITESNDPQKTRIMVQQELQELLREIRTKR